MRALAIIISVVIAGAVGSFYSWLVGALIGLACLLYQLILEYSRSETDSGKRTTGGAIVRDVVRNGVFLVPLAFALQGGLWYAALATVVVFGINLMMS
jgi:hypothetical protein